MNDRQNYGWKEMTMGVCYYPEHWDKKLWADDLERMQDAGITVIRIAEFAWNKVEPAEGHLWNPYGNAAGMADGEIPGSIECNKGRDLVPAWWQKAL